MGKPDLALLKTQGETLFNELHTESDVRKFTATPSAKFSLDDWSSLFNGVLLHL